MKIRPVEVALFRADIRHDETKIRFINPPPQKKTEDITRQYVYFFYVIIFLLHL